MLFVKLQTNFFRHYLKGFSDILELLTAVRILMPELDPAGSSPTGRGLWCGPALQELPKAETPVKPLKTLF